MTYSEYKSSGVEWISEIPKHWNIKPIWSISKKKSITDQSNLDLLSVYLDKGVIKFTDVSAKRTNATSDNLSNYQLVEPGDFVLNNQQAWRGSVGVSNFKGIVSPAYFVLELSDELERNFSNYMFRDRSMVAHYLCNSKGVGTIQRNLYFPHFSRVPVFIPPLQEQQQIAKFLDYKTQQVDSLIEKTQQKIELLKEQRTALVNQVVTNGLDPDAEMKDSGVEWIGEIPVGWEVRKMKFGVEHITDKKETSDGDIKISPENMESNTGICFDLYADYSGFGDRFQDGDVLLNKLRIYLKKVLFAEYEGYSMGEMIVLRSDNLYFLNSYLYYILFNQNLIDVLHSQSTGIKVPRVGPWLILNSFLPCPALSEQEEISGFIEKKTAQIDSQVEKEIKRIELLKEYRNALISEVVTGKIDVREEMVA
jgi:type I restriction enzyme, S subunit